MKAAAQLKQEGAQALSHSANISQLIVTMRAASVDDIIAAIDAQGYNDIQLEHISNHVGRLPHRNLRS